MVSAAVEDGVPAEAVEVSVALLIVEVLAVSACEVDIVADGSEHFRESGIDVAIEQFDGSVCVAVDDFGEIEVQGVEGVGVHRISLWAR